MAARWIALAMTEATQVAMLAHPAVVLLAQDEDHASAGEWLYLAVLVAMTIALVVAAIVSSARHVNPHSRLRSKVRRRRSRRDFHGKGP
jgi:hypothetical protein